ncbi:hypothetical protein [Lichenicola sp.]|uniref:hypothetical protein n=1 Tax=Lichenicola sp. TaxID=2804529 RepID=UPI003B00203F
MILRIDIDEGEASIEEVADGPVGDILARCQETPEGYRYGVGKRSSEPPELGHLRVVAEAVMEHRQIKQLENGTVIVEVNGVRVSKAKPVLRELAIALGISRLNGNGGTQNTRQLGADIIAALTP